MKNRGTIEDQELTLSASAFRVYAYIYSIRNIPVGIRQVQRALGFSSPSSAIFQLEKLQKLGLVQKQRDGTFCLTEPRKMGALKNYLIAGGIFIPWMLIYAIVISFFSTSFLILFIYTETLSVVLATVPSVVASIIMFLEARKIWNARPKFQREP